MTFRGEYREAPPVNLEKLITHKLLDLSYPEQRGATRDDARAKAVNQRLRSGGPYEVGDRLFVRTPRGGFQPVEVTRIDEQSDHPLAISLVDRDDGRQTSPFETTVVTREELDKYCRGERMLLTGSLMLVENDLGGATVPFDESHRILVDSIHQKLKETGGIPDLGKFYEDFFETCRRQGIPVARHFIVGAHLGRGIDRFYREDPPDYQALLDGLMEVARFHNASIPASVRIHAFNPREGVFEQVPPVEAALFLQRKYAERQESVYDAITRLLSLMKQETGNVGVMVDAPVEE